MFRRFSIYKLFIIIHILFISIALSQSTTEKLMMLQLMQSDIDEQVKNKLESSDLLETVKPNDGSKSQDEIIKDIIDLNNADQSVTSRGSLDLKKVSDTPQMNSSLKQDNNLNSSFELKSDNNSNLSETVENKIEEGFDDEFENQVDEKDEDEIDYSESKLIDYFGYDLFRGNPEFFQSSISGAVDPNYLVGPGDEIIIMLWGDTELNESYYVSKDGYLFIKNVGQIYVNGLTIEKVEKKLFKKLKKVYSSLDNLNNKASTFFDVSLGSLILKPLRIFVLGEVHQPGAYTVKRTASLFSSLFYFNGPTNNGSLRNIQLIRNGKIVTSVDYYDYLLTGKKLKDSRLQNDDVIFIPPRGKTVKIFGEVKRPAIYELKEDESLKDLIKISAGLKTSAYMERARVDRIIPAKKRMEIGIDRTIVDVSLIDIYSKPKYTFELFDGDSIEVFSILSLPQNIVYVDGSVNRPGAYSFENGLSLVDLIAKADGLTSDAYLNKVDIFSKNKDFSGSQISVSLKKAFSGDESHNIDLNSNDSVKIYSIADMIDYGSVTIKGYVLNPGVFEFRSGMTVSDLIFLGGGLEKKNRKDNVYYERADLVRDSKNEIGKELIPFRLDSVLMGHGMSDTLLKVNDEIYIYALNEIFGEKKFSVSIEGQVKRAGTYPLAFNMTLGDLLFKAGGFEDDEFLRNTYRERSDLIRTVNDKKILIPFKLDSILSGSEKSDLALKPDDLIKIYSNLEIYGEKDSVIAIGGHVKRPGSYQLTTNMRISDLLFNAGGLDDETFFLNLLKSRADISRIDSNLNRTIFSFNVGKVLEDSVDSSKHDFFLKPGDRVTLYSKQIFESEKFVNISGDISRPGKYILKHKMRLSDLILESGGLKSDIKTFRVEIASLNQSDSFDDYADISTFYIKNNESFYLENKGKSIFLKPFDYINISSDPYFVEQKIVTIEGEVNYPGDYVISNANELVTDIIDRAGGLTANAYPLSSSLVRNEDTVSISFKKIIKRPRSKINFVIQDKDLINIGSKTNLVKVLGGVNAPGTYQFVKGQKLDDYIRMAGGLTEDASRWLTYVNYPDGKSKKVSFLKYSLIIEDGSIINVGMKAEVEPFSFTAYVTNLTSIYADFTQAVLMMKLLLDS